MEKTIISIQDLINKKLKKEKDEREHKNQDSWHASSIGNCLRGQYIQRLGIVKEEPLTERDLRVFSVGRQMEEWVISCLKDIPGIKTETQVRIEDKTIGVSGYADVVIRDLNRVYEIKTKHSRAFWHMEKSKKPMRQHEYQLWLYLKILNIPEGIIVYLSKDDMAIGEYVVKLDDAELEKEVMERINLLNRAWEEKNILLLPLPKEVDWQAKYCRVHKYCKNPELLNKI